MPFVAMLLVSILLERLVCSEGGVGGRCDDDEVLVKTTMMIPDASDTCISGTVRVAAAAPAGAAKQASVDHTAAEMTMSKKCNSQAKL